MESTKRGPENSNQINVSTKKNPNFYVFLGKKYLEEHETVELHALGNAVSTSVIAAENLVRYATILWYINIETNMLPSKTSVLRQSQSKVTEEIARKPSYSSLWREVQNFSKTWRGSTRSEKRMRKMPKPRKKPKSEESFSQFLKGRRSSLH